MIKNYFNDNRPNHKNYIIYCSECRVESHIKIIHYPHGQNKIKYCPVCKFELEKNNLKEVI